MHVNITVNGEKISLDLSLNEEISLSEFLQRHNYDAKRVAVEKNGDIVPRKDFESELLSDGDKIEIVHFVGGG